MGESLRVEVRFSLLRICAGSREKMVLTVFSMLTVIFHFFVQVARVSRVSYSFASASAMFRWLLHIAWSSANIDVSTPSGKFSVMSLM